MNEEWNCDKGRFAFTYATANDRFLRPALREPRTGELRRGILDRCVAGGGRRADAGQGHGGVGVLAGGRLTVEDAYAYAKFARVALRTNDIDFRVAATFR